MTMVKIGPKDFDPYRQQFRGCECPLCREMSYALSDVLDFDGRRHYAAAEVLLSALRDGTHSRVELAERVAELKAERAGRIAEACASGAGELRLYGLYRGMSGGSVTRHFYHEPYSEGFMIGTGIGMTPGRYEAAEKRLIDHRRQADANRAAKVPGLIAQDGRNACTYFRVAGELCRSHVDLKEATP